MLNINIVCLLFDRGQVAHSEKIPVTNMGKKQQQQSEGFKTKWAKAEFSHKVGSFNIK